ncbi:MAG: lysophospholipid acyltransferase family protein [Myxococcota bacterium]
MRNGPPASTPAAGEDARGPDGTGRSPGRDAAQRPIRPLARWLGWLGAWLLRGLARTWRWQVRGEDPVGRTGRPAELGAVWHRDILLAAVFFRDRGYAVPVSRSRDGDFIASALVALGFAPPPRGSSSRGGSAALRTMTRSLRSGTSVAALVDGPRGPAGVPKPGLLWLSQLSGTPITPVAFAARPVWRFGSWDRTRLPPPFARVACGFGDALTVPRGGGAEQIERSTRELTRALEALASQVERDLERPRSASGSGR